MAKRPAGTTPSVADIVSVQPFCDAPDVEDLTPEQVAALHMFKHQILAAAYQLYTAVPVLMVDPLLSKFLTQVASKLVAVERLKR